MRTERLRRIAHLALPIVGGMMSQNILNLVDTAMVGVLGTAQLAGVGVGAFATFMAAAMVMGLSSGVQAMAARRVGEGRRNETAVPLTGGLVLALIIGLPLSILLIALAPTLFSVINDDPAVVAQGVPYFEWRLTGVLAVGMNFAFRGYWTGVGQSKIYLRTLLVVHVANVAISYVLIFGKLGLPALGTTGAGVGTALSLYLGSAIYFVLALRLARKNGFLDRIPGRSTMMTMLRLAVPTAFQQFLFATGLTTFFWIVGLVGTAELAASNVIVNLLLVAYLPGLALGMAALTLVGEALGRGDREDAARWGWEVSVIGVVLIGAIGLPAVLAPDILLSGFIHESSVIAVARSPLRLMGAMIFPEGIGMVLMHALLGAGAARQAMTVTVGCQWLVGLPLAWIVGPYLGFGLTAVWACLAGYRILQAAIFAALWKARGWSGIRI